MLTPLEGAIGKEETVEILSRLSPRNRPYLNGSALLSLHSRSFKMRQTVQGDDFFSFVRQVMSSVGRDEPVPTVVIVLAETQRYGTRRTNLEGEKFRVFRNVGVRDESIEPKRSWAL